MIKCNGKMIKAVLLGVLAAASVSSASAKRAKNAPVDNTSLVELNQEKDAPAETEKVPEKKVEKKKKPEKVKVVDSVPDEGIFQAKTVENTVGRVKYLMKGTVGSFQMYALGENGSQTPVFAGYDEFTSSFLSLLAGKKEYKLTDNIGIVIGARKNELGAQLVYIVPDVARVFLKFEQVENVKGVNSEIIKVTSAIYNKGKYPQVFSLKQVYDTVLGEQFGPHFSTADELAVNNERQFRKFDKVKWVTSRNSRAGIQFLFDGGDISTPEVVSLSNKDFLALRDWIPSITVSRTFDSVLSYQNSAMCINWPSVQIKPGENASFVYYIAVATDGAACDGEKYIEKLDKMLKNGEVQEKYSIKEFEDGILKASELYAKGFYQEAHAVVMGMWMDPENRNERLISLRLMIEDKLGMETDQEVLDIRSGKVPAPVVKSSPVSKPEFKFDSKNITKAQLDAGYVQSLIDRINMLEGQDEVDRNEIFKLNAELDAILEKLRKQ